MRWNSIKTTFNANDLWNNNSKNDILDYYWFCYIQMLYKTFSGFNIVSFILQYYIYKIKQNDKLFYVTPLLLSFNKRTTASFCLRRRLSSRQTLDPSTVVSSNFYNGWNVCYADWEVLYIKCLAKWPLTSPDSANQLTREGQCPYI